MEKQKQIEEMAKIIRADYKEWLDVTGCIPQGTSYYAECLGGAIDCAELLYNAGYRKISENAVVLTDEKDIKQFEWSKMLDKMGFFKFVDNLRKETAEKFAERLKEKAWAFNTDENGNIWDYSIMKNSIDEIYKEITEGK